MTPLQSFLFEGATNISKINLHVDMESDSQYYLKIFYRIVCDNMSNDGNPLSIARSQEAMILECLQALICPGKCFFTCGMVYAA